MSKLTKGEAMKLHNLMADYSFYFHQACMSVPEDDSNETSANIYEEFLRMLNELCGQDIRVGSLPPEEITPLTRRYSEYDNLIENSE